MSDKRKPCPFRTSRRMFKNFILTFCFTIFLHPGSKFSGLEIFTFHENQKIKTNPKSPQRTRVCMFGQDLIAFVNCKESIENFILSEKSVGASERTGVRYV